MVKRETDSIRDALVSHTFLNTVSSFNSGQIVLSQYPEHGPKIPSSWYFATEMPWAIEFLKPGLHNMHMFTTCTVSQRTFFAF